MNMTGIRLHIIAALMALFLPGIPAGAFAPDRYAENSVLATGRWVKISVASTGLYRITSAQLKSWGFTDPDAVRIYGYGGNRISDRLSADTFIDDLPQTPCAVTASGIVFYGVGAESWSKTGNNDAHYVQSLNPYSTEGYYFVTADSSTERTAIPANDSPVAATEPVTTFTDALFHEEELNSLGNTGTLFLGEDFRYTRAQTFSFQLPDRVENTPVWMQCAFYTRTVGSGASLTFTANGTALPAADSDKIQAVPNEAEYYGAGTTTSKSFDMSGTDLRIGIEVHSSAAVQKAYLDYLTVNYTRQIALPASGSLLFRAGRTSVALSGATGTTHVWDVTDPLAVTELKLKVDGTTASWVNEYTGDRHYAAWNENASLPSPELVGNVPNQNLHAIVTAPTMIIVTPKAFKAQAERLAELHRNDPSAPLTVEVVDLTEVYNEFGSGCADPGAIRRLFKTLHDRGGLRYALLFGRAFFDNRRVTAAARTITNTVPTWQSQTSVYENSSYMTDDIYGFLSDDSGLNFATDKLSIAVGRIPAHSVNDATVAVDKISAYLNSMPHTTWKNRVLLLADDENGGIHMTQTETSWDNMTKGTAGSKFIYDKIYIDAYTKQGGTYPEARRELFNTLDEGVVWWQYAGHASATTISHENIVTYTDFNNMYLRQYPVLFAATCNLLRWDTSSRSAAEVLHFLPTGGTIATISAVRPAYITPNGDLTAAVGATLTSTEPDGTLHTIGEIYRLGKNRLKNDTNKLRFVLMGDPALSLATPSASVVLESINGSAVTPEAQITLMARQDVTLNGSIVNADGTPMTDFNGIIAATLYDAERSATSNGYGKEGAKVTFERHGLMLYTGRGTVSGGKFTIKVPMPSEIAYNFRPATFSFYAYSTDAGDKREAAGTDSNIYVYGYDESVDDDTTPPEIAMMVLNHEDFRSGDSVNESPMLIADVADDTGINLSSAGIGHSMTLTLDGKTSYSDVAQYFVPEAGQAEDKIRGSVYYQLTDLTPGSHELRLRVWDTTGNLAEKTIGFNVVQGLRPQIFDVYTDANPATTGVNFYISHNRPDARCHVRVTVYNLLGSPVWTSETTGLSDMFSTAPLHWDLTDSAGRRVQRGIYIYRASISTNGEHYETASRKLAVAAQ